ncbi:MAG TPA: hypothetical protein VGR09_01525 [Gemmatimonadales bacterium]|nr:hypothetical protein [Gemmatimonadales bacterium]
MPSPDAQPGYKPSQEAVRILCERLQGMGVSMSEPAARSLLESVLAVEGPRLDALARGTLQASLEAIRNAAEAAWISLTGKPSGPTHRNYELSFPPASQSVSTSGPRRRVPSPRPVVSRKQDGPVNSEEEARPVFKGRRGR